MHNKILLPRAEISACDVELAIVSAHFLISSASYTELAGMLDMLPMPYQERVITLLRDVLCAYPNMRFGLPVLMFIEGDDTLRPVALPLPTYQPPGTDVEACSWLSIRTLRSQDQFGQQNETVKVLSGRMEAAVLLLNCRGETPPVINDEWLGDAFCVLDGRVSVTVPVPVPMPWPDAVEAATAMLANSQGSHNFIETPQKFLSYEAYLAAQEDGRRFRQRVAAQTGTRKK